MGTLGVIIPFISSISSFTLISGAVGKGKMGCVGNETGDWWGTLGKTTPSGIFKGFKLPRLKFGNFGGGVVKLKVGGGGAGGKGGELCHKNHVDWQIPR